MSEEKGKEDVFVDSEEKNQSEEIFTKVVRAGKRTYFFDVKATKKEDFYLTITESKKRVGKDGKFFYEKHKIFLYKEDFDKFKDGLSDTIMFVVKNNLTISGNSEPQGVNSGDPQHKMNTGEFTDIEFDDLG